MNSDAIRIALRDDELLASVKHELAILAEIDSRRKRNNGSWALSAHERYRMVRTPEELADEFGFKESKDPFHAMSVLRMRLETQDHVYYMEKLSFRRRVDMMIEAAKAEVAEGIAASGSRALAERFTLTRTEVEVYLGLHLLAKELKARKKLTLQRPGCIAIRLFNDHIKPDLMKLIRLGTWLSPTSREEIAEQLYDLYCMFLGGSKDKGE